MTEEWRPVPDWPDYWINRSGSVISYKRGAPRLLTQFLVGGYRTVGLSNGGTCKHKSVHVLVALTFIGERPDGMEVRHLDGNPLNCAVENLAFGTRAQNMQDRLAHGRHPQANKTHCPRNHEYTPENTVLQQGGHRVCRTCKNARQADYVTRRALRAANVAA